MSTLRISNIEAKSVPASATIDEKVKITNSSGDVLVFLDGKTSGITKVGINTTDANITFDANSNVVVTGIITATKFSGQFEPTSLDVSTNLTLGGDIIHSGDDTKIRFPANDIISFETAGTERARIDSGGRLLVGTTSNSNAVRAVFQGYQGGGDNFQARVQFQTNQATDLASGSHIANLLFTNASGSVGAQIDVKADAAWGTNDYPARIEFKTTADSANSPTERLRIKSNGIIVAGNDGASFGNARIQSFVAHGNTGSESAFSAVDTTSVAEGVGGEIAFHGKYNTGAQDWAYLGHIRGIKENATNGNTACALTFHTRPNATGPSERLRITSDGKMGLGITSPTGKFAVSDGTRIAEINPHSSGTFIGNRSNHDVLFQVNAATKAKIDTNGHLTVTDGNLVMANGRGIDFSATANSTGSMSNELLDDYEEGVFTPTLSGGTSQNNMYYTKIGRVVHISGSLAFNNISGSGNMVIGGLPYTSINGLDSYTHLAAHAYDSLNVSNQTYQFQTMRVNQGSTNMMIIIPAGNGNVRTFAQYSHVSGSTFRFRVAGYYITA